MALKRAVWVCAISNRIPKLREEKRFGKTIPRKYQQHKLKEWRDLTFIMMGIYSSMQRNEKCFAANQLHDAVKRLCNFAANWLHYAVKQLCSKVTRHQNCHTTAYISYAWSNLILFHTSTMNRVETCLNHKCMGLSRNLTKLSCLIEMCNRRYS